MKRLIIQTFIFCSIVILVFLWLLSTADGYTDPFYLRFTTSKQENLILGTSRAAQGLQPAVFSGYLRRDLYNYSFTVAHSPYGPVYLKSIQKKLKENTTNGIFIIAIDPWCISSRTKDPDDSIKFEENQLCLGNTSLVNINPNFQYLIKNLAGKYYTLLYRHDRGMFLNDDGWLEINATMDSLSVSSRLERKIIDYRTNYLPQYKLSKLRLEYLRKTMQFLKAHGQVYLVRLPVHPRLFEIELEVMPEFHSIISSIEPLANGYLDMTNQNNEYQYTDGNHLYKESGKLVSRKIAKWIKENMDEQGLVSDRKDHVN